MNSIRNDIKQLRQLILQTAIQGKLVPQDPNDEPVSMLLGKIEVEKSRLIKEEKIKKGKPLTEIKPEEIPFEIPNSWKWLKLNEIGRIIGGGTPSSSNNTYFTKEGGTPWFTPKDLTGYKKMYIGRGARNITESGFKNSSAQILPAGSILFSSRAPIGYIAITTSICTTNQGFKSVAPYILEMNTFIYFTLMLLRTEINIKATGTTFKEISGAKMEEILFPLPPLPEQQRIVQKIEELMKICDEIDQRGISFEDKLKELKSAILLSAIQGKLVPQDANDEPASVLLGKIKVEKSKQIKERKIKKVKALSEITPEELPYKIPSSWEWVRLGNLIENINGKAFKPSEWNDSGIPIVRIQNLNNINAKFNYCRINVPEKYYVNDGDLLVGWSGTPGTSFGAFIWKGGRAVLNQHIFNSKPYDSSISKEFIRILINARLDEMISKAHGGVGLRHITKQKFDNMPVPLPPLKEQVRIVQKVDELFQVITDLRVKVIIPKAEK